MRRTCKQCGKTLRTEQKKFCSSVCHRKYRKVLARAIGSCVTKCVRGQYELFTVVGYVRYNGILQPRLRRNCVLVLEDLLGRKLSSADCKRIVFLNGNRLDVSIDNLVLPRVSEIRICKTCGIEFNYILKSKRSHKGIFCSVRCCTASNGKPHIIHNCLLCGIPMSVRPYDVMHGRGRFCSRSHSALYHQRKQREERLFVNRKPNHAQEE